MKNSLLMLAVASLAPFAFVNAKSTKSTIEVEFDSSSSCKEAPVIKAFRVNNKVAFVKSDFGMFEKEIKISLKEDEALDFKEISDIASSAGCNVIGVKGNRAYNKEYAEASYLKIEIELAGKKCKEQPVVAAFRATSAIVKPDFGTFEKELKLTLDPGQTLSDEEIVKIANSANCDVTFVERKRKFKS